MSCWIKIFARAQGGLTQCRETVMSSPMVVDACPDCGKGQGMDYEKIDADGFGRGLRGIGLNLLVRDVAAEVAFLTGVFGMRAHQPTADFAIMTYGDQVFQLHSDGTYHSNPLLGLLPENPPRGGGIEIRLYDTNPEQACALAPAHGGTILQEPTDKPHGLREAYILCENGYAWVPSRVKDV